MIAAYIIPKNSQKQHINMQLMGTPLKGTNQAMKNRRMLLQTVALIIISFILSTLISVNSLTTVIDGNNEEMSKVLASNIYDSLNNMLVEPIIVAQTMSNDFL